MTGFDRITADNWTVAFPADWVDRSEDGKLYFEAPDGEKGFYVELWVMSEEERRGPEELISSFQKTELKSFFPEDEDWEVSSKIDVDDLWSPATGPASAPNAATAFLASRSPAENSSCAARSMTTAAPTCIRQPSSLLPSSILSSCLKPNYSLKRTAATGCGILRLFAAAAA